MNALAALSTALLLLALSPLQDAAAGNSSSAELAISAVRGRDIEVQVPVGYESVTLQALEAPARGHRARGRAVRPEWKTVAVQNSQGAAGVLVFTLEQLTPRRMLRVLGERTEPLPGTLLTGITHFLPEAPGELAGGSNALSINLKSSHGFALSGTGFTATFASGDSAPTTERRTVAEADIWKLLGDRLLYFNERRGLQIFDVSNPDQPALVGTLRMPGLGEDMYLLDDEHVLLLKKPAGWHWMDWGLRRDWGNIGGSFQPLDRSTFTLTAEPAQMQAASLMIWPPYGTSQKREIVVVNIRNPQPEVIGRVEFEGFVRESRLVGKVLYLATDSYRPATETEPANSGLEVSSFDLHDPATPIRRASVFLGGWMRAVTATDGFFLASKASEGSQSTIDAIDISDPRGAMARGGSVTVAGEALDKFKMHEANRILTVVSQKSRPRTQAEINELLRTLPPDPRRPVWITTSPVNSTEVNTFSLAVPAAPVALGRLELAPDETLHGTRFDGSRLYIITAKHKPWIHVSYVIDPLWIVDLTNPATPTVLGELEMPGYSTYIEPLGDRLVTIGLLDQRPTVSLFDISDPTKPAELSRVQLDAGWSEAVWNEKAFSVLPEENLILLPVSGSNQLTGASAAGVQLLDLHRDFIVKRGILQRSFAPRRATLHRERILAISPESLIAADATDRDNPKVTADMEIAWNVDRVFLLGDQLVQLASEWTADGTHRVTATTAPVGSPDDASEVLEIPGGMLADAVVRDGVLYLVQVQAARTTWDYELYTHRQVSPGLVTLSSIEVSKLPQLSVLSSVASAHPSANMWSQYSAKALWLGETSLAVTIPDVQPARLIPYWYDPAPYEAGNRLFAYLGMASTGAVASPRVTLPKGRGVRVKGRVIDPAGSWLLGDRNPTTQHILAFDVSTPSRLLLASRISIGKDQPWDVSAPIAAEGRLYAGFRHLGAAISGEEFYKADRSNPDAFKKPDGESLENRHFVQAVDYSDLENPIAAAKQPNIPGRLVSTTFSGDLLLTVGQHYNPETGAPSPNTAALHASALRGESAHLLDQLPLRTQNDPLRFRGSVIFHFDGQPLTSWLRPSLQSRVGKSTLSTWKLGEVGKFEALDTLELGQESMFSIYNELGVAMATPNEPHLLDLSDPTNLVSLGTRKLEGAPHMNYEAADGAVGRGLWIPTGSFGLESLSLGE